MLKKGEKKTSGKTVILLFDGECWHGGLPHSDGTWEQMHEPAAKSTELPESLLHWGLNSGALRVRVALPADPIELELDVETDPLLLNPAELYLLLCDELAEKTGMDSEDIAPSAASFPSLAMGPDENRLLAAAFDRARILDYHEQCEHHGLKFDGLASFPGVALALHARTRMDPKEGLFFFGRKQAFIAGVPQQEHLFSCRPVPAGIPDTASADVNDRRLARRIKSFLSHPLCLIVPNGSARSAEECVRSVQDCTLRTEEFSDLCTRWMQCLADAAPHLLDGPVGLVGLPPKVKDAKYTGGVICGGAIVLTLLVVGSLWAGKARQKYSLEKLKADITALESAQKSAESAYNSVQDELNRVRRLYGSLSSAPPKVSRNFSDIAMALSRTLPKYSRITSVVQGKDFTRISGSTQWAQEVSRFSVDLQEELRPFGLRVVPMDMKPSADTSETLFEMEIR
jgi:hypothetical protein